jgi:FlaA1/EpsC-like NDP-sugar epimerase
MNLPNRRYPTNGNGRSPGLHKETLSASNDATDSESRRARFEQHRFARNLLHHSSYFVLAFQGILVFLSFISAWLLLFEFELPQKKLLLIATPLLIVLRLIAIRVFNLHHGWWRYSGIPDAVNVTKAVGASSIIFWLVMRNFPGFPVSIYFLDPVIAVFLLAGARVGSRALAESVTEDFKSNTRCIVIGAGGASYSILREICRPNSGYAAVGCVDDDPSKLGLRIHGIPVLGTVDDLPSLVDLHTVEEILIAVPSATDKQMERFLEVCSQTGVKFRTLPSLREVLNGAVTMNELREVRLEDLLGRRPVQMELAAVRREIEGRCVLITGAAGSIGSELCRQIIQFDPACLVCVDQCETALFHLQADLMRRRLHSDLIVRVADVTDATRMRAILEAYLPGTVFHAAAYKHVPMMENNVEEAIKNNVFGLITLLNLSEECGCESFILISSDKAVNPTSVMGTTKRIGELVLASRPQGEMRCASVRFGNVLGTAGSVVPVLQEQLRNNEPLTLTDPEARRFFMTLGEAVALVIQAFAIASHGDILVLDMGEQLRILDVAHNLIKLSGRPPGSVAITYTGLRPGEKLGEELFYVSEQVLRTRHDRIKKARGPIMGWPELQSKLEELRLKLATARPDVLRKTIREMVPQYRWTDAPAPAKYFQKSAAED